MSSSLQRLRSDSAVERFIERVDGGGFSGCTSPQSYSGLASGAHTFEVRASDSADNTDLTSASFTWTVL